MKLLTYELTATKSELLKTEILFYIASSKALRADVIRFNIKEQADSELFARIAVYIVKHLRSAKKDGTVQLYMKSWDLQKDTTEAEYLFNKFPQLSVLEKEPLYFLVKL